MAKAYTSLLTRYQHEHDRSKFSLSQHRRAEIMNSIRQKIKRLERFLTASDQVAAFEQSSKVAVSSRSVKNLIGYWRHADRIYALISSSWICSCKQSHCAHLWLQHRTTDSFEFRMLVLFAPKSCNTLPAPRWQQHGIQIDLKCFDGQLSNQVLASALLKSPQKSLKPPTVVGQVSRPGILSKKAKSGKTSKASVR
jgi:hypothetical protein